MPCNPDPYRPIPCHTLHPPRRHSLFFSSTPYSRRQLRMTPTNHPRHRKLLIFHLPVYSYWARNILWLILPSRNMKHWHPSPPRHHTSSLPRIRPSLRTNKLLRRNSYYKPLISNPLRWHCLSRMSLRGIRRRQSHTHPILCHPLRHPIRSSSPNNHTLSLSPPNRIQQPPRTPLRPNQNPLPHILLHKRPTRRHNLSHLTPRHCPLPPQRPHRPRKLHPSQSTSNPPTHYTRMILFVSLRYSPVHPQ